MIFPFADPCCNCVTSFELLSGGLLICYQYPRGQSFISGSPCFFKTLQTALIFSTCLAWGVFWFLSTHPLPSLAVILAAPRGHWNTKRAIIHLPVWEVRVDGSRLHWLTGNDPQASASIHHASEYSWHKGDQQFSAVWVGQSACSEAPFKDFRGLQNQCFLVKVLISIF